MCKELTAATSSPWAPRASSSALSVHRKLFGWRSKERRDPSYPFSKDLVECIPLSSALIHALPVEYTYKTDLPARFNDHGSKTELWDRSGGRRLVSLERLRSVRVMGNLTDTRVWTFSEGSQTSGRGIAGEEQCPSVDYEKGHCGLVKCLMPSEDQGSNAIRRNQDYIKSAIHHRTASQHSVHRALYPRVPYKYYYWIHIPCHETSCKAMHCKTISQCSRKTTNKKAQAPRTVAGTY